MSGRYTQQSEGVLERVRTFVGYHTTVRSRVLILAVTVDAFGWNCETHRERSGVETPLIDDIKRLGNSRLKKICNSLPALGILSHTQASPTAHVGAVHDYLLQVHPGSRDIATALLLIHPSWASTSKTAPCFPQFHTKCIDLSGWPSLETLYHYENLQLKPPRRLAADCDWLSISPSGNSTAKPTRELKIQQCKCSLYRFARA